MNHNKLIFIIEDNDLYSLMLDYNISNESIARCMCFRTGEECIGALDMNPMMIILDYELPGMNGKETLKKIKALKPEIPVIILSIKGDPQLIRELLEEGAFEYLMKEPDSVKKLKKIINSKINKLTKDEWRTILRMKLFLFFVLVSSLVIVAFYLKRYLE
ncbi:MAG TPA: response regulator [Bacteroidia bacterium]